MSRNLIGHPDGLTLSLEGNPNLSNLGERLPYVPSEYTVVLEEPGRRFPGTFGPENRMAFNYVVARGKEGYVLFVKTGSGQHQICLYDADAAVHVILGLQSDQRFAILHGLARTHCAGIVEGENEIRAAFLEGRLVKAGSGSLQQAVVVPREVAA